MTERVLIVDLSARFGGAGTRVLTLLEALPEGSAALACLDGSPVARRAGDQGAEVFVVARRKWDPRIPGRLARLVREQGFALLDAQNPQSKLWAALAAMRTGAALVSTLNSWYLWEHGGRPRGRGYQSLERLTAPRTDCFITVSEDILGRLRAWGLGPERAALVPNAVGVTPETVVGSPEALVRALDIPGDAPVVVAVGRLVEAKGYPHLLAALARPSGPSLSGAHLVIVGEGHLRPALEVDIRRLGLGDRVHLAGERSREETLAFMRNADLFVMPSVTEGTPFALLEAGALARPIVASAVGGIPAVMRHGEEALLVGPGDEAVLAEAMAALLEDRERAGRLGDAARRRVASGYGLEAMARRTMEVYALALARRR